MSTANTLDTLNGLFKVVYADKLEQLIPESYKMINLVEFSKSNEIGKQYNQPVILGQEHGVTFAGPNEDAYNLNGSVSGQVKEAVVKGYQMVLRSSVGVASILRSAGGGEKAFKDATKVVVENMLRSFSKKLEIRLLYGQMGLGTVASKAGAAITVTTAEWAPGIWAGAEKMKLEIRNTSGVITQDNVSVQSVNFQTRTLTLDAAIASAVAPTDVIWEKGSYGKEMPGLHKILTNTGTLFDIDATEYSLWQANQYDCASAAISFQKIQEAVARAVEKGLDSDVTVLCSHRSWPDLITDQDAARMFDSSYSPAKGQQGSKEIEFYGQNGMMKIMPSIYVKEGYAYIVSQNEMMRIGSTDITFKLPSIKGGDEYFRLLENTNAVELRAYSDQSLFCYAPGKNVLLYNIVNS